MTYLAFPVPQIDGTKYGPYNCGCAVCSLLLKQTSCDTLRITPAKIRAATGETRLRGLEGPVLSVTMARLTANQYPFTYRRLQHKDEVLDFLAQGPVGLMVDTSVTIKTKYRTNRFAGNHWWTLSPTVKDGTVKYEDPGTTSAGWQRIPLPLAFEAARAVHNIGGGPIGDYFVLTVPPTENVRKTAIRHVAIRQEPDRSARRLAGLAKGDEVFVIKTTKGGMWRRADGTEAHGWHVIRHRGGKAFVKGEGLR